jgi:hypothetical protein
MEELIEEQGPIKFLRQTAVMGEEREEYFRLKLLDHLTSRHAMLPLTEIKMIKQLLAVLKVYHDNIREAMNIFDRILETRESIQKNE